LAWGVTAASLKLIKDIKIFSPLSETLALSPLQTIFFVLLAHVMIPLKFHADQKKIDPSLSPFSEE